MSYEDLADAGANYLEHYGVKGMKWGKRKAAMSPTDVTTVHKGRRLKAQGGQFHTPHEDAKTAITARQIATKSGKHALSNKDLQAAVNRMNLEQQFDRLNPNRRKKGQAFIKGLLGAGKTANELVSFSNSPAGQQIRSQFS